MSYDALRDTFFTECEDLLEAVATGLAEMEEGTPAADTINAVFRAVHSIKGAAGAFELTALVGFAHRFETVLDAARSNRLAVDGTSLDAMRRAGDVLADLVEATRAGHDAQGEAVAGAVAALDALLGPEAEPEPAAAFDFAPLMLEPILLDLPRAGRFEIAFAPRAGFYENGHDPATYLHALSDLGAMVVSCDLSRLPRLDSLDPEQGYLSWTISLETERSALEIEEVFAFAEGLCELRISPVAEEEPPQQEEPAPPLVLSEAPPAPEVKTPPKPEAAEGAARPTLRVDLDRVDRLVNSVGELIINRVATRTSC